MKEHERSCQGMKCAAELCNGAFIRLAICLCHYDTTKFIHLIVNDYLIKYQHVLAAIWLQQGKYPYATDTPKTAYFSHFGFRKRNETLRSQERNIDLGWFNQPKFTLILNCAGWLRRGRRSTHMAEDQTPDWSAQSVIHNDCRVATPGPSALNHDDGSFERPKRSILLSASRMWECLFTCVPTYVKGPSLVCS